MEARPLKMGNIVAKVPLIQGGMGVGISLGRLAGTVAKEGGIGIISAAQIGFMEPDFDTNTKEANLRAIKKEYDKARAIAPDGIIGFNIMVAMRYYEEYVRAAIDAGADLVIGSHPHVLQGIEYYKGKPIVYSLGNFIFGSSIPKTALLQAEWDGRETKLSLIPGVSSAGYTRMLQTQDETREFYEYMTGISYGVTVNENGQVSETE